MDFYIFDYCVTDNNNIVVDTIKTVCTLEETLQKSDNLSVGLGDPKFSKSPANFSNAYTKEFY